MNVSTIFKKYPENVDLLKLAAAPIERSENMLFPPLLSIVRKRLMRPKTCHSRILHLGQVVEKIETFLKGPSYFT